MVTEIFTFGKQPFQDWKNGKVCYHFGHAEYQDVVLRRDHSTAEWRCVYASIVRLKLLGSFITNTT